ncbi:hypothetical protein [Cryptosporangium japonicum]|uniref:hypothetical protein n=1 Tax=Cryptosporangium japonicum TaxID=80872 RepID=UPI0031CE4A4B
MTDPHPEPLRIPDMAFSERHDLSLALAAITRWTPVSRRRWSEQPRHPVPPPEDRPSTPPGIPVVPIRAIGIAGEEVRIAPTAFGARELAWSPHPDRTFRPRTQPQPRPEVPASQTADGRCLDDEGAREEEEPWPGSRAPD